MEPTEQASGTPQPKNRRREYVKTLIVIGWGLLVLPMVLGRPPIGQEEANRHRLWMTGFIVCGAVMTLTGYIGLYLIDRAETTQKSDGRTIHIPE